MPRIPVTYSACPMLSCKIAIMKSFVSLLTVCILFVLTNPVHAQIGGKPETQPKADERVRRLLDESGLNYEIDGDGDFRLVFEFEDGRSQLVFIRSVTWEIKNMEIREVFSPGYLPPGDEEMSKEVMENLLKENAQVKLGAWEMGMFNGKNSGLFRAKIAADTDVKTIVSALEIVCGTADDKEEELLGTDDL